jgi:hypothetical protein
MKKVLLCACVSVCVNLFFLSQVKAQTCSGTVTNGQNLVINGDFSQGYAGWTHNSNYIEYTPCSGCYSVPGNIYAGSSGNSFNSAFTNINDHTSTADNMMLMVDAICTPDIKLWSQSNIPISPNTNYYFSVWVHALKDGNNPPGTLRFDINGVNLDTITAPTNLATGWIQFEAVWFSGATPPATATISIENTTLTGCATATDFAIDDITFIPGCAYGAPGPQPDLGPDKTLCGTGGSITIDANVPHLSSTTVTWWDGVSNQGSSAAFYTRNITAPGTYWVCVSDNGSCLKSDVIVITNTFSISLGPAMTLCSPASATLDPGYSGTGVTYLWKKDGVDAPAPNDNQTYFVNTAGTYSVTVTDPSCGSQTASLVISSTASTPVNGTYCAASGTVSVTGSGTYKWYDTPTKGTGTLLTSGTSYSPPAASLTAPNTYTYYAEDVSSTSGTVGPTTFTSGSGTDWGVNSALEQAITITQDVQITSLKIPFINCNTSTGTITIEVRNSSNTVVGTFTSDAFSVTSANNNTLVPITFTNFKLLASWGTNLRLDLANPKTINASPVWNSGNVPAAYPFNGSPSGIISSPGAYANDPNNLSTNNYCYFYDIHFQTGVPCDRVPVQLSHVCPSCTLPAPIGFTANVTNFCKATTGSITLTVDKGSTTGDQLVLYSGNCGGTKLDSNTTGIFTITPPSVATDYYVRWESAGNCKSTCLTIKLTPVSSPSAPVAGIDQKICTVTSTTLHATRPAVGTGAWSVFSGTGSITNTSDSLSGVTGIGAGNLVLIWTVSNSPCASVSDSVTIQRSAAVTPDSLRASVPANFCKSTTVNPITLTVSGGSGDQLMLYSGSCGGTKVDSNTTGNPFTVAVPSTAITYFARWESANNCNSSCVSITLTPVADPSISNPGPNQNICNPATSLHATRPAVGTGLWSVVSGTGTITNPTDSLSGVTGIGVGDLVLAWTVSNSPCVASSKNDTIHNTAPLSPASMGSDIIFCKGSLSTITIPVSGGSGDQLMLYSGACGGTKIDSSLTVPVNFTLPAPATVTDYFARWESAGNCNSSCLTIKVTPVDSSSVSNAGTNQNICNADTARLHATRPANGTGAWSVVSGTGTITNTSDSLSTVTGIGAGNLVLQWAVTSNPCPASSDTVIIHRTVSVAPDSIGKVAPFCKGTSTINLTVFGGSGDSLMLYAGSCGGIRLGSNATGAAFVIAAPTTATTYFARWESANSCNSSCDSITVTPVDSSSASNPGTDQNICNTNSTTLHAVRPTIGIGAWSVVSGIGTIANTSDSLSAVTAIGAGNLVLQWTVSNNPCPASSNQITIRSMGSAAPDSLGKVTPFCNNGTISTINIQAFGGSGDSLILYKGSCAGVRVDGNATGAAFVVTAPNTATTYFARWESANSCISSCASITVTPVELPSKSNPGSDQNICNTNITTLHAVKPAVGTGLWSVVSGTGTVTNPADSLSNVTGIGVGDLVLAWTVSNGPCPDTTNQVTIHRDSLSSPVLSGASDTCASTMGAVYSTAVNHPSSTYSWTTTGTLNVASQSNNTATVNVGTSGGTLKVSETSGVCTLADSITITIAPNITQPFIPDSMKTSCIASGILVPANILLGSGHWTVSSGSAVFADANDPHTTVTGLGNGANVLTWTVTGCGGPLSANVTLNVATASGIVLHATGPSDTICIGKPRDMSVSVAGGSGGFLYTWSSSNNSFAVTTKNTAVAVSPQSDLITYYVFATDTVNSGCLSNLDSVKVHTVAAQTLISNNLLTPNHDGMNERLIVTDLNTKQAILPGSSLEVYNRWGERVFRSEDYDNTWDAAGLNDGVYYYYMKAGCGGGQFKGWIEILGSVVK